MTGDEDAATLRRAMELWEESHFDGDGDDNGVLPNEDTMRTVLSIVRTCRSSMPIYAEVNAIVLGELPDNAEQWGRVTDRILKDINPSKRTLREACTHAVVNGTRATANAYLSLEAVGIAATVVEKRTPSRAGFPDVTRSLAAWTHDFVHGATSTLSRIAWKLPDPTWYTTDFSTQVGYFSAATAAGFTSVWLAGAVYRVQRRKHRNRAMVLPVRAAFLAIREETGNTRGNAPRRVERVNPAANPDHSPLRGISARIQSVNDVLDRLDQEWYDYRMNSEEYFLTKPLLRDTSMPFVREYRDAFDRLRDLTRVLRNDQSEHRVAEAERTAEEALMSWGRANDAALREWMTTLTPSERSALRRIRGLVSTLEDPSTPEVMWKSITDTITALMEHLERTPVSWNDLELRKEIEGRTPRGITVGDLLGESRERDLV